MNIFVNCNNLDAFREFVKTYSKENKKYHFIFGRHLFGSFKIKVLEKIMEVYNGEVQ